NTYISYYDYGAVIALALDLTLRTQFDGISLDTYMRALWERFGLSETPYTMADLEDELGRVSGDPGFARRFFASYIRGGELPELGPLLARAGLELRTEDSQKASLGGVGLRFETNGAVIQSATRAGSPLYEAGLDRGAKIVQLDGKRIRGRRGWNRLWRRKKPGDTVRLSFEQRGRTGEVYIKLVPAPRVELVPFEKANRKVTERVRAFRQQWLGPRTH
ncbi:MAG: PDZ domain-containing protein, partial [bacterium]|nr:PDZ domain-containing protein [bacterium]